MEPISFRDLIKLDERQDIDNTIQDLGRLSNTLGDVRKAAEQSAAGYVDALGDITKSASRLDDEMGALDSTLKEHQDLIAKNAAIAEKLVASQQATTAAMEAERKAADDLRKAEEALAAAQEKLNDKNLKQAGSIAALRVELQKAEADFINMGNATSQAVKDEALKKIEGLNKSLVSAESGLKKAKQAVDIAAGSYDALVIEVEQARKELKAMEGGIGSNSERFKQLQKTVKDGTDKLKEFDKSIGDNKDSSEGLSTAVGALDNATGGAVGQVKNLVGGFKAIMTSGVGIFLAALAGILLSLKEYFEGSVEGQDNFNKLMRQGQAILETFMGYIGDFGKLLYDTFSEPKEALKDLLEFMSPVAAQIAQIWEDPIESLKAFGDAIVENIINRFKAVGVAIEAIQMALDGDLVGSFKKMADAGIQAVTGVTNGTDKIKAAYDAVSEVVGDALAAIEAEAARRLKLANQIAELENQIRKDKIKDIVDDAQTELDVYKKLNQAQDKLRNDANARFAAQKEAGRLLQDQLAGDLKLIQDEIKLQKLLMEQTDDNYEEREKLANLQAQEIKLQSDYEKAFKKRQATERQLLEEAEKDRLAIIKREQDAQRALADVIRKSHIEANKQIIADERTSLDDRISLLNENAEIQQEQAKANYDRDLALAREAGIERVKIDAETLDKIYSMEGASADQINAARREAAIEALKSDSAYIDELSRLNQVYSDEVIKINEETVQATTDNVFKQWEKDYNNLLSSVDATAAVESLGLNQALEQGNISFQEYQDARQAIQEEAQLKSLKSQLAYLKQQEAALRDAGFDTTQLASKIAETELAISDAKNAKLYEGERLLQEKTKELKQVAFDTALSVIESFNEREDMAREERLAKLEAQYEIETQMAGDNEAAKMAIENQYNLEKAKIEKEQRAADRKRAIFQKTMAVVEIAINTAKGIALALGTFPPPVSIALAAVVGAIGALQVAAVLAKPIPAFAEGTEDAPGGLSIVNEDGPELIIGKRGARMINSKGPALTYLDPHDRVITAEKTARIFADTDNMIAGFDDDTQKMRHIKLEVETAAMTAILGGKLDGIREDFRNQKQPVLQTKGLAREVARGIQISALEAKYYA